LDREVSEEVDDGHNYDGVGKELVRQQVHNLNGKDEAVKTADAVDAGSVELEGDALFDGVSQHFNREPVDHQSYKCENRVDHVEGGQEDADWRVILDNTSDENVEHVVERETEDENLLQLFRPLDHLLLDEGPLHDDGLYRVGDRDLSVADQEGGETNTISCSS